DTIPEETVRKGRAAITDMLIDAAGRTYEAKESQVGDDFRALERWVMLETIDQKWVDYLTTMEHFREGIGLQAYGQRDPLVEYKNEAFRMFTDLTDPIQADIVTRMFHLQFTVREEAPAQPRPPTGARGTNGHLPNGRPGAPGQVEPVGAG